MTDIIEEARAMLAQATYGSEPWDTSAFPDSIDLCDRKMFAAAPRLLTALADECERLRVENARLREAMPSEVVEKDIDYLLSCIDGHPNVADEYERVSEWLARLDAAKGGLGL